MGVGFVQTQYCYDLDLCKKYSEFIIENNLSDQAKFIVGLGPLKSAKQASWMRENLYGVKNTRLNYFEIGRSFIAT